MHLRPMPQAPQKRYPHLRNSPQSGPYYCAGNHRIEYISTKSFNYAVDLYLSGQQTDSQRWARKAIELSQFMREDCGSLALVLQGKYEKWLTYDMVISDS